MTQRSVAELFQAFDESRMVADRTRAFSRWGWDSFCNMGSVESIRQLNNERQAHQAVFRFRGLGREREWCSGTINKAHKTAVQVCAFGVDCGALVRNYVADIKYLPKGAPGHVRRPLTLDELQGLLTVSPPRFWRMWLTYALTGMRPSELVELTWDRVHLDDAVVRLRRGDTKTRTARYCILGTRLVSLLRSWREDGDGDSSATPPQDVPVFPNEQGLPFRNNLLRALRRCLKAAGIPKTTLDGTVDLHSLRVTFGTLLTTMLDAPIGVAKALIGHGQMSTGVLLLDKYCKPNDSEIRPWAQKLEDLILG